MHSSALAGLPVPGSTPLVFLHEGWEKQASLSARSKRFVSPLLLTNFAPGIEQDMRRSPTTGGRRTCPRTNSRPERYEESTRIQKAKRNDGKTLHRQKLRHLPGGSG